MVERESITSMTTVVSYDSRAITINGQRTMLLGGAIHYPRSTPEMWPALMQRSREAGLNAIETYIFWNLHERQRGVFDFSERLDVLRFCQLAQEHGLYVVLRIGPYICAETNYGGLPAWLRDVPGIRMRTWNEPFMREMERWVRFVVDYLRPMFASNGGPIILAQIENEYANVALQNGVDGMRYLQWAADLGKSLDLGIPLVMCLGAAQGTIETINGFYGHTYLDHHFESHPDQPALWTENWPGWYDLYGHAHRIREPQDVAYSVVRFIAGGGTGVNYYMWHGGTNFGREAMYLQTTSYDYDAPLDEYGRPTTKYHHLARLHRLLLRYADVLLNAQRAEPQLLGNEQAAYIYGDGELIFLCNDASEPVFLTFENQHFELAAQSTLLLSHGKVLLNTAEVAPGSIVQRTMQPAEDTITRIAWHSEPLPTTWPAEQQSTMTLDQPIEQLQFTQDTTDYCWYTTRLFVPADQEGMGTLTLVGVADVAHVFVDGQLQATTSTLLPEDRGSFDGDAFTQSFKLNVTAGEHELSILCCALGLIKGDWMIGYANMAEERKGLWGHVLWNEEMVHGDWSIQPGLIGERGALFASGGALVHWNDHWNEVIDRPLCWWRINFTHPQAGSPLALDLSSMQKGLAWLNGRCIGRYWLASGEGGISPWFPSSVRGQDFGEPPQRYYHLPAEWLQPHNTLVLFEELGGDPSSIAICPVEDH